MKGFSVSKKLDKMGMRGSDTAELVFEDCEVPEENVMGGVGRGAAVLMSGLDYERAVLAAGPLGIMQACLDVVLPYVRDRKQFGKAIGSFQALQHRCVDMFVQKELGAAALDAVLQAWPQAHAERRSALASRVKARCADAALDICRQSIQMHGAMGFTDDCDVGLYLKRALVLSAWLGNAQAHRRRYANVVLRGIDALAAQEAP